MNSAQIKSEKSICQIPNLPARGATLRCRIKSIKQKLIAQGVKYCIGAYVDIHGVPKGKFVPIAHFEAFRPRLGALHRLRARWPRPVAERRRNRSRAGSRPRHAAAVAAGSRRGMPADNHLSRRAVSINTRVAASRTCSREAAEMGFSFNLGIECEVYFVKQDEQGQSARAEPRRRPDEELLRREALLRRLPLARRHGHDDQRPRLGPLLLRPRGRQLAVRVRLQIRRRADHGGPLHLLPLHGEEVSPPTHGLLATFMPKPFADKTGNGAHFNMSLADAKTGANLFASEPATTIHTASA